MSRIYMYLVLMYEARITRLHNYYDIQFNFDKYENDFNLSIFN